nr:aromatic amino acid ammonia-lyase [Bdellovibrionales bacterium]
MTSLDLDGVKLDVSALSAWTFRRTNAVPRVSSDALEGVKRSHAKLLSFLESGIPIYGVTTGFGDSGKRAISRLQSEELQRNLVSYLLCGSGPVLPVHAARAALLIRLNSMCRGLSGVSPELVERLQMHAANDWVPVIPREGSLGASGDLVPLAYLAANLRGEGQVFSDGGVRSMADVLRERGVEPYRFRAKEALAIVNGTSAMAGLFTVNLNHARFLLEWSCLNTAWLCLALGGRTEAFGPLVNERAKSSRGQAEVARLVRERLDDEDYRSKPLSQIHIRESETSEWVQDRYSLRCVPQILGPVFDTLKL